MDKSIPQILFVPAGWIDPVDKMSDDTLQRCSVALGEWGTGQYQYMVLSGGIFRPPAVQTRPAAEIMRDWFMQKGVDSAKILCEGYSRDTFENVSHGLPIIEEKFDDFQLTLITHSQHALRCVITFRAYGIRVHVRSVSGTSSFKLFLKECLFFSITGTIRAVPSGWRNATEGSVPLQ